MKPPSGTKKQTQFKPNSNPVLPALRSFSEGWSASCPELAEALSAAEGVVEWVEWANFKPITVCRDNLLDLRVLI